MKAKQFYRNISSARCVATCVGVTEREWESYMEKTVKADANKVEKIIKELLPDLASSLDLRFYNPFRNSCRRKPGLIVYVHSGIEYFIKVS